MTACIRCNAENAGDHRFCKDCGAPFTATAT
jgi:uncharacterized membrane protein YvbJ